MAAIARPAHAFDHSMNGSNSIGGSSASSSSAHVQLSLNHLSQLSVPQLAALQHQLSTMQQQQQGSSESTGMQTRSSGRQVAIASGTFQALSPSHTSPSMPFHSSAFGSASATAAFVGAPVQASTALPVTTAASSSSATTTSTRSRRTARASSTAAAAAAASTAHSSSSSSSNYPSSNLKLKRKLRKNTREKQRRSEINDQFEILCHMLGLGGAPSPGAPGQGGSGTTIGAGKVEKFAILSEACHQLHALRDELHALKAEKASMRKDYLRLSKWLHASTRERANMGGEEMVLQLFHSLHPDTPDYTPSPLPPSADARQSAAAAMKDEDEDESDEEEESESKEAVSAMADDSKPTTSRRGGAAARSSNRRSTVRTTSPMMSVECDSTSGSAASGRNRRGAQPESRHNPSFATATSKTKRLRAAGPSLASTLPASSSSTSSSVASSINTVMGNPIGPLGQSPTAAAIAAAAATPFNFTGGTNLVPDLSVASATPIAGVNLTFNPGTYTSTLGGAGRASPSLASLLTQHNNNNTTNNNQNGTFPGKRSSGGMGSGQTSARNSGVGLGHILGSGGSRSHSRAGSLTLDNNGMLLGSSPGSAGGSGIPAGLPTHRPRQHNRSSSGTTLPRFGSMEFGPATIAAIAGSGNGVNGNAAAVIAAGMAGPAVKASHSRQASLSHARNRSIGHGGSLAFIKQEHDPLASAEVLKDAGGASGSGNGNASNAMPMAMSSGHSRRTSSHFIPPPPALAFPPNSSTGASSSSSSMMMMRSMHTHSRTHSSHSRTHSHQNSMDFSSFGFSPSSSGNLSSSVGGVVVSPRHGGSKLLSSLGSPSPRNAMHANVPSHGTTSAFNFNTTSTSSKSIPSSTSNGDTSASMGVPPLHARHRSVGSMMGSSSQDMMFTPMPMQMEMEDVDTPADQGEELNVFDAHFQ